VEHLHEEKLKKLELQANSIRQTIIDMLEDAGSGHTAGPLGMTDIFTAFYFHILNHDPKKPDWEDRDRLILSNGHIVPVRYATMAHAGYFPVAECKTLRKFGSRLQGHPEHTMLPGLETTSGPLGSGLGQAAGIALGAKMDGRRFHVYCLMSDGELDAGNSWEAAMFASANKLNKLVAVIDRNNIQINGTTEGVMPLEPLRDKWEAFNWHVLEVDGHNIEAFVDAVSQAHAIQEKPTVIIAHTIPGKGVDFMERDYKWHGIPPGVSDMTGEPPKAEQGKLALEQLRTLGGKIKSEHQ